LVDAILICPAILLGIIIAIVEFMLVHGDEPGGVGMHHAAMTFIPTLVFVFISMNISYVYSLLNLGFTENQMIDLGIRAGVTLIAIIWINGKASIGRGIGEKLPHSLAIGALIFGAPYIWDLVLKGLIGSILPCP
jgi:hypothetical protein